MNNQPVITLDIDWAPDFVIDFVTEQLVLHQVKATWFVTHASPAIDRLRQYPELFELGVHPNFLPGSSQGDNPTAVLDHCLKLVPEATSLRTHALVQSSFLLQQILMYTPITTDVSLFLPHAPGLCPVEHYRQNRKLLRIPYFWEDDFEMERPQPCWRMRPLLEIDSGLKIFDFHPIHIYLNSADMIPYETLKKQLPNLNEVTSLDVAPYIQKATIGTQTTFLELVEHLAGVGQSACIRDLYYQWENPIGENLSESCCTGTNPDTI